MALLGTGHDKLGIFCSGSGEADLWLVAKLESLVRATIGLQSRTLAVWLGGVYQLVRLTAKRGEGITTRASLVQQAATRWRNLLAVREACAAEDADPALDTLNKTFLWGEQVVYSEIHTLLAEGKVQQAEQYPWKVHCGSLRERGTEQILRTLQC